MKYNEQRAHTGPHVVVSLPIKNFGWMSFRSKGSLSRE